MRTPDKNAMFTMRTTGAPELFFMLYPATSSNKLMVKDYLSLNYDWTPETNNYVVTWHWI